MASAGTTEAAALAALSTFLDICMRAEVRQITMIDAPTVFGWAAWREIETEYGLGLITELLRRAMDEKIIAPQQVDVLAQLLLSQVIEAGLIIASAENPEQVRPGVEQALWSLAAGLFVNPG